MLHTTHQLEPPENTGRFHGAVQLKGGPSQPCSRAFNTRARGASSIATSGSAFFANALTEALVQLIEGALDILSKNMTGGCKKRCIFSER